MKDRVDFTPTNILDITSGRTLMIGQLSFNGTYTAVRLEGENTQKHAKTHQKHAKTRAKTHGRYAKIHDEIRNCFLCMFTL